MVTWFYAHINEVISLMYASEFVRAMCFVEMMHPDAIRVRIRALHIHA